MVLYHIIGFLGLVYAPTQAFFIKAIPLSILALSAFIVYININALKCFLIFSFGVFSCVMLLEILGVHVGELLGKYNFGDTLGFKIAAVPVFLGVLFVNWIYAVGQTTYLLKRVSPILRALLGSILILVFDYFLEPVAAKLNYWDWDNDVVPTGNYITWFILSYVLLHFFYALHLPQRPKLGAIIFIAQLLLFTALYLFL